MYNTLLNYHPARRSPEQIFLQKTSNGTFSKTFAVVAMQTCTPLSKP